MKALYRLQGLMEMGESSGVAYPIQFMVQIKSSESINITAIRMRSRKTVELYSNSGKPMIWNEALGITADEGVERYNWFKEEGICCFNYYGTRNKEPFADLEHEDPDTWRRYCEEAGKRRRELNQ